MSANPHQICNSRVYVRYYGIPTRAIGCLPLDPDVANAVQQLNSNPPDQFISIVELANAIGRNDQRAAVAKLFKAGILYEPSRQSFFQLFSDFPSAFSQIELLLALDDDLQRTLFLSLYRPKNRDSLRDVDHVFATLPHFDTGMLGGIFLGYLGSLDPNLPWISVEYMRRNVTGGGDYLTSAVTHHNALRTVRVKYFSSEWSARLYVLLQQMHPDVGLAAQGQQHQLQPIKLPFWGVTVFEKENQAVIIKASRAGWVRNQQLQAELRSASDIRQQVDMLFKKLKKTKSDLEYYNVIDTILALDPQQYRAYVAKGFYMGFSNEHNEALSAEAKHAIFAEVKLNFEIALRGWEDRQRREPRYFILNPEEMRWYTDTQEMLDKLYRVRSPKDSNPPNPE